MSHNLNSLKGILLGSSIGVIKGDTRSVDYSAYGTHDVENSLGVRNAKSASVSTIISTFLIKNQAGLRVKG